MDSCCKKLIANKVVLFILAYDQKASIVIYHAKHPSNAKSGDCLKAREWIAIVFCKEINSGNYYEC